MGTIYVDKIDMITVVCNECHICFAIPHKMQKQLIDSHKIFYCPNGHGLCYPEKSDTEKLAEKYEKEIQNLAASNEHLNECCIQYQDQARKNDYRARHYKGRVTRLKRSA